MFKTKKIAELDKLSVADAWLVKGLWPAKGVGIIAAEPKCGKTWLALDVALSVASGTPCLGEYQVEHAGKVLFYNGEDAQYMQRDRLESVSKAKGLTSTANLEVIEASSIKLDVPADVASLRETVRKAKPALLILDPFVRMHSINENNSARVAELLNTLRAIQRDFGTAVILVHHSSKGKGKNARGGQKMRGSGELHAWGDANLYLNKTRDGAVTMDVELRTSTSTIDVPLELVSANGGTCMRVKTEPTKTELVPETPAVVEPNLYSRPSSNQGFEPMEFKSADAILRERILDSLFQAAPTTFLELKETFKELSITKLTITLYDLEHDNLISVVEGGYCKK